MLRFFKLSEGRFSVHHENGVKVGELYMEVDGYFVYWPSENKGFIEAWFLHAIADKLDEMNAEWDRIVHTELSQG